MQETVNVGIVGLGLAASSHFKGYATHPYAEVIAVCDLSLARAEHFAVLYGIANVYTSYEEMLKEAAINTVDIATPTFMHASMTRQAAELGKHIHCEKPFCRSVDEGQRACQVVDRNGVKLVVGETYLFIASHIKARKLIEAGEIGRPLQIRQQHGPWLERESTSVDTVPPDRNWRVDGEKSGGGDHPWIFDHAPHLFVSAEFFMLDQKITEVYAVTGTCRRQSDRGGAAHDPYTIPDFDIPIITWKYENTDCQGVWMRAERLNGKYNYMHGFSTTIIGEHGVIQVLGEGGHNLFWEDKQQHLVLHREGKQTRCFRFDEGGDDIWRSDICYYSQGHINQVHHLIHCIREDTPPRYTGADGVHAVRCTLATIRSAREARPVLLDEISNAYTAYQAG